MRYLCYRVLLTINSAYEIVRNLEFGQDTTKTNIKPGHCCVLFEQDARSLYSSVDSPVVFIFRDFQLDSLVNIPAPSHKRMDPSLAPCLDVSIFTYV